MSSTEWDDLVSTGITIDHIREYAQEITHEYLAQKSTDRNTAMRELLDQVDRELWVHTQSDYLLGHVLFYAGEAIWEILDKDSS